MKKGKRTAEDAPLATEREQEEEAAPGGGEPASGSPELEQEAAAEVDVIGQLDHLQAEFGALNDRHLRLAAEFSNYRRRAETEMGEAWGRAQADFLRRFLEVLDDLQRVSALDPSDEAVSVQAVVKGVDLVERKFGRALEDAGVEVVEPAPGDAFDPETMEAVMRVPAEAADEDDTVHQLFQKGYRFRSQLVRPARVSVRKHE